MNKYGALVNAYRFELTANYDNRERLLIFQVLRKRLPVIISTVSRLTRFHNKKR